MAPLLSKCQMHLQNESRSSRKCSKPRQKKNPPHPSSVRRPVTTLSEERKQNCHVQCSLESCFNDHLSSYLQRRWGLIIDMPPFITTVMCVADETLSLPLLCWCWQVETLGEELLTCAAALLLQGFTWRVTEVKRLISKRNNVNTPVYWGWPTEEQTLWPCGTTGSLFDDFYVSQFFCCTNYNIQH